MVTKRSASVNPIETLREHSTSLQAAITLALADPTAEPVHRLRTSTRRIEAQMELLELLPELPEHRKPAKKARRLLKKLRRAAGAVRDFDVQRKLLEQMEEQSASKKLGEAAHELRRTLKRKRAAEAEELLDVLKTEQRKLAPALEDLLEALEPAKGLSVSEAQISELTLRWYGEETSSIAEGSDDEDSLHEIRKYAKLARYLAEAAAPELAESFERLQEAGGVWHDLMTLAEIAEKQMGSKSALTRELAEQRDAAREAYRKALEAARKS